MTCALFATIVKEQGEIGTKMKEAELLICQRIRTSELSHSAKSNYGLVVEKI